MAIDHDAKRPHVELSEDMVDRFRVAPGTKVKIDGWSTKWDVPPGLQDLNKEELKREADEFVKERVRELADLQDVLWADGRYALLLVFQGPDASGKDSTIKHVTSGMNPAGVRVVSFKEPSQDELRHNYLWRYVRELPEQGEIGVFNRSHYEEVCVVRVKPELLRARSLPAKEIDDSFWRERFEDINLLEQHLARNGTKVLKFFLHLSREEQKKRLLQRLDDPRKQWKFSPSDIADRDKWDAYQHAYAEMLTHTSTAHAPWWIMPADRKWAMRALVAHVLWKTMRDLDLRYPPVDDEKRKVIALAIEKLNSEN
jgi:PPK2 family polyphosphate:nucleotide phosphotransferase